MVKMEPLWKNFSVRLYITPAFFFETTTSFTIDFEFGIGMCIYPLIFLNILNETRV